MASDYPPVIALIRHELRERRATQETVKSLLKDRGFRRDLSQQAAGALSADVYPSPADTTIGATLPMFASGPMNPLAEAGRCSQGGCRMEYTRAFARSTCLYADRVVIADLITASVESASHHDRLMDTDFHERLALNVQVLDELRPLIDAGIVQLSNPFAALCRECSSREETKAKDISRIVWDEVSATLRIEAVPIGENGLLMINSDLFASDGNRVGIAVPVVGSVISHVQRANNVARDLRVIIEEYIPSVREQVEREVLATLRDVRTSSRYGATLATNYRLSLAALDGFGGSNQRPDIQDAGALRDLRLPWLSGASVRDVVKLREATADALPAFRQRLRDELSSRSPNLPKVLKELAAEAIELESKLRAADTKQVVRRANLMSGLGFFIGLYGFSTGNPAGAIAGLGIFSALLKDAEKRKSDAERCHTELTGQPAYVFVQAQHLHPGH